MSDELGSGQDSCDTHQGGPMLEGAGPAWPPAPEPVPVTPKWVNGRAFPAVWREILAFTAGGLRATATEFPQMRPGAPWDHRPKPDSDADIGQAIAAKIHLGLRMLPLLAGAQVVLVDPGLAQLVPEWDSDDEEALYAAEGKLPSSPLFLDLESERGLPVGWEAETWPFPFHLRAALCWVEDEMLSVIPFGSVGGKHPWGGSDYHAWARWIYLQGHPADWPDPGPGDFIARASGDVLAWVDCEQGSICAHHGAVAYNLSRRVLSVLMAVEAVGGALVEPQLQRSLRRRAAREGQKIALIPERFLPVRVLEEAPGERTPSPAGQPCVVPQTHARLEQAHALWHEALASYGDPDEFVTKLNALIQALRTVTWVLRKEFGNSEEFNAWYAPWESVMESDRRMKWAVKARNAIEKRGDLDTHSVAHVRVKGSWLEAPVTDLDVDPTADAAEIARRVTLVGLPERVRSEGILEVERRWTLPELAGDELLDALAHCYGVLARIVAVAHEQRGEPVERCVLSVDQVCGAHQYDPHPSGRLPCMLASREARTSRRDLATGALYELEVRSVTPGIFDPEETGRRYAIDDWEAPAENATLADGASALHELAKRMLVADGNHIAIAWLLRDGRAAAGPTVLHPEDQRDKYMMMEQLAAQANRLGADAIIFSTEAWGAGALDSDDPRAELRPGEREDRTEALLTFALQKGQSCHFWRTGFTRVEDAIKLEETEHDEMAPPNFLRPVVQVWDEWRGT